MTTKIALTTANLPAVREVDDPDLFVNYVRNIQRRRAQKKAQEKARKRAVHKVRMDREQEIRNLTLLSQFTTLGVVVALGLWL